MPDRGPSRRSAARSGPRASQRLSGSTLAASPTIWLDWRYVADVTIVRRSVFVSQPLSMNSIASQSSNSGCVGGSPCDPKSSLVNTMPRPNRISQYRLGNDASCQRIILINQPARQLQPIERPGLLCDMKRSRQARFDHGTLVEVVASIFQLGDAAITGQLAKDRHGSRRLLRPEIATLAPSGTAWACINPLCDAPSIACNTAKRASNSITFAALFICINRQHRRFILAISVLRVIQNGEQLEILFLRDRIKLVGVALSTCHSRSHPHRHRCVHLDRQRPSCETLRPACRLRCW